MALEEECGGVCVPSQGVAPGRQGERKRPSPQGLLLSLGLVMTLVGGFLTFLTLQGPGLWIGVLMAVIGATLTIAGLCILMTTLQVSDVPGHFLLHPRTGTRYSPHQALALQRRLDRIRREMSEESVRVPPSLPLTLPPTPPPWDLEAPPSYDSVMKSRGPSDL